jgi:hypothetical protein
MKIPKPYHDLLRGIGPTVFSVIADGGSVQSSLVWSDLEDELISISMLNTAPKLKSLINRGKATILKIDPENEDNYISIRCSLVQVLSGGAIAHVDKLTLRHYGKQRWYGDVVSENDKNKDNEVVIYLKPEQLYCSS